MSSKRKEIPKEEAYQYFLDAFEISKIAYEEYYDPSGNALVKPREKWHFQLAEVISEIFPEVNQHQNYPKYLKERFNHIKRILYDPSESTFGFHTEHFDPLIRFSSESLEGSTSRTFSQTVLISHTKYPMFNIWRTPDHGLLTRYGNTLRFDGDLHSLTMNISALGLASPHKIQMPPFKGEWLMLNHESKKIYLAISRNNSQLDKVDKLLAFLSPV